MPSGKVAQPAITDNKDGTVTVRYAPVKLACTRWTSVMTTCTSQVRPLACQTTSWGAGCGTDLGRREALVHVVPIPATGSPLQFYGIMSTVATSQPMGWPHTWGGE